MMYIHPNGLYPLFLESPILADEHVLWAIILSVTTGIVWALIYGPYSKIMQHTHPNDYPIDELKRKRKKTEAESKIVKEYYGRCALLALVVLTLCTLGVHRIHVNEYPVRPEHFKDIWLPILITYILATQAFCEVVDRDIHKKFLNLIKCILNKFKHFGAKIKEKHASRKCESKSSFFSRLFKKKNRSTEDTTGKHPREEANK